MARETPDLTMERPAGEAPRRSRGRLKIFFGYAAGVGKTYAMLKAAQAAKRRGVNVVAGYIGPHTRPETMALPKGLEALPSLRDFDLDGALRRKPLLILVDELAHANAQGCRHAKRHQDIEELLARVRVTLRRISYMQAAAEQRGARFSNGALSIDFASGRAYLGAEELHLAPVEYKLLCLLAKNVGKVLAHAYITREIWGGAWESDVASLRKKIEADPARPKYVQTRMGVGYRVLRQD